MPLSRPQQDHCDLGLIEDDKTPDLRPGKNDDPRAATPRPSKPLPNRK